MEVDSVFLGWWGAMCVCIQGVWREGQVMMLEVSVAPGLCAVGRYAAP